MLFAVKRQRYLVKQAVSKSTEQLQLSATTAFLVAKTLHLNKNTFKVRFSQAAFEQLHFSAASFIFDVNPVT